ncbi:two-component regulator propeller domain-containing protein [Chitinophaga sp.]|mgnify:CR=1 FL=1|uniref:two-component regulator propeller domain-containing protein n=1 Tax=Chitinophaga sp. TaxID=1869181 RepID=UPI002613AE01|nr:two-component regulator propeller domain-containing protein [uncultured Chitinophaga sp.]
MKYLYLLLALLFTVYTVKAQSSRQAYVFSHLTIHNGLSGNHVSGILQDKKGFIWIASNALQRFDGENYITITQFDRLPGSIYYDDIALYEDRQGHIWIGAPENIRLYDPVTTRISTIPIDAGIPAGKEIGCYAFLQDHKGQLYLTSEAGLLQLDPVHRRFRRPAFIPDSISVNMQSAILEDAHGRLWISGEKEMYMISQDRQQIFSSYNNPHKYPLLNVFASVKEMLEDQRGRIWAATRITNELLCWTPDSSAMRRFQFRFGNQPPDQVYELAEDHHGNIWAGMKDNGLYRYNDAQDTFSLHIGPTKDSLGLHLNYETNCLVPDRDGHLWVGTDVGVNILSLHNEGFTRLDQPTYPAPGAEVTGLLTAKNGDVYMASWGGGFSHLRPDLSPVRHYTYGPNGLTEDRNLVWSLAELPSGTILVGQENGMISEYDPVKQRFRHHRPPALHDQAVLTMFPENDTTVWIGLYKEAMSKWNPVSGEFLNYPQITEFIRRNTAITAIVPGGDSLLWLGSSRGGVLRFSKKEGKVTSAVMFMRGKDTVRNITALLPVNDTTLLAGTDHGVYFYYPVSGKWEALMINNRQFNEWILSMAPAGNNRYWLTTQSGFYRLNGPTRTLSIFVQNNDIITDARMVRRSIVQMADGRLLVGATDHAIAFSPDKLEVKPAPPDVTIVEFRVLNNAVMVDSAMFFNKPVYLHHDENFLGIDFKSLQYHGEKLQYFYQLEGLDKDWLPAENVLSARYTNLPPGEYTFNVKSMNTAGIFSRNTTSLHIVILPAFWQTWWFRTLLFLLAAGLVYGYFRFRMYLVKKEARSKAAFREELSQLEMKALRAQMNPHFIFNALNSIQTFMLKNETDTALAYLSRFAKLIRNVLDHSQLNNISITRETEMLENYLELERLRLDGRFDYTISIDPDLDQDFTEIPAMVLQPFVENAIWHGLQHKNAPGKLYIGFTREGQQIHCVIEDDGIGREAATVLKQQSHPAHVSRGLQITKDRLQIYNSRYNMDASFDIEDLTDENGHPSGTRVNLWFPLTED